MSAVASFQLLPAPPSFNMASCDPLSSLTPEQLAALHAQTSFLLIADLPHGSVLGLDGT